MSYMPLAFELSSKKRAKTARRLTSDQNDRLHLSFRAQALRAQELGARDVATALNPARKPEAHQAAAIRTRSAAT